MTDEIKEIYQKLSDLISSNQYDWFSLTVRIGGRQITVTDNKETTDFCEGKTHGLKD